MQPKQLVSVKKFDRGEKKKKLCMKSGSFFSAFLPVFGFGWLRGLIWKSE
jgi:hypothetical protein